MNVKVFNVEASIYTDVLLEVVSCTHDSLRRCGHINAEAEV